MNKENKMLVPSLLIIIILLIGVILVLALKGKESSFDTTNDNPTKMQLSESDLFEEDELSDITTTTKKTTTKNKETERISKEKAANIALKDAKVSKNDIRDFSIEVEYKYGQTVYEIDFDYKEHEYEYYINVESGKIVKSFKEKDFD